MQNMQRRFDKEKESLLKFGSEKILKDLLDVVIILKEPWALSRMMKMKK
jgi:molecular chaperone GrpE (heat shock protein)